MNTTFLYVTMLVAVCYSVCLALALNMAPSQPHHVHRRSWGLVAAGFLIYVGTFFLVFWPGPIWVLNVDMAVFHRLGVTEKWTEWTRIKRMIWGYPPIWERVVIGLLSKWVTGVILWDSTNPLKCTPAQKETIQKQSSLGRSLEGLLEYVGIPVTLHAGWSPNNLNKCRPFCT